MYQALGYHCTNYIDDFGSAKLQETSSATFHALSTLFTSLGLDSSPDKDSPPSASMVFLGILVNTDDMTVSVTLDRLHAGTVSPLLLSGETRARF